MTISLTDAALYAALSEQIYRRNQDQDQSLKLSDILPNVLTPLQLNLPANLAYLGNASPACGGGRRAR